MTLVQLLPHMCKTFFEYRGTYAGGAILKDVNGNKWQYQQTDYVFNQLELKGGQGQVSVPRYCQNWTDLPKDIPLDSVEVLRHDKKGEK